MQRRLLALVPSAVLALCLYLVDLPLWVESPGGARSVLPLIAIDGPPTYDSDGRFLLTTVNLGRVNLFYALRAWLDPTAKILSEREVLPSGQTDREHKQVSLSQMDQSKIAAVAVALESATDYPDEHGEGVIVHDTLTGTPAHGRLFPGDLITSVNGTTLGSLEELRSALDEAGTEGTVRFEVRPVEGGDTRGVTVRTVLDEDGRPIVGIIPVPNFPFDVRIESGSIGGPSAGLMWALGVTDLLSPDDLTGDDVVAGTGTVDLDGDVGPIGGIALKVKAAELAKAETFLLPQANLAEARGAGADIRLVPVNTVDQAVSFLEGEA
ncbi:MAG: YlbL family protein [Actinomycetota bacterium]